MIVGKKWSRIVELLFICSCFVQAIASLVETAQSLDGFLANIIIGWTAAIKFEYNHFPQIIYWSPSECYDEISASGELIDADLNDCVPFADAGQALVLSLGYVLTSCLFFSFGLGSLNETIVMQLISFACFFVLLSQFFAEFIDRGFDFSNVPLFGDSIFQLAGVVLFNFAFSVTVPSWLSEKEPDVSVNKTIWSSSSLSCVVYILFGTMGALSFSEAPGNMLILLASKKVCLLTRICAAFFGASIIGAGVPVFCVIIKTTLYNSASFSARWSLFCGAFVPYLVSWTLYQGERITTLLNWAGLVINGVVAFILPLVITYHALEGRKGRNSGESRLKTNGNGSDIGTISKDGRFKYESIVETVGGGSGVAGVGVSVGEGFVTGDRSSQIKATGPSYGIVDNDVSSDNSDEGSKELNVLHALEDVYAWMTSKLQSLQHAGSEEWKRRFGEASQGGDVGDLSNDEVMWKMAASADDVQRNKVLGVRGEDDHDDIGFQDSPLRQSLDSDIGFRDSPTTSPAQTYNFHVARASPSRNEAGKGRVRSLSNNDINDGIELTTQNDRRFQRKAPDAHRHKNQITIPFFKPSAQNVVQPLPDLLLPYKATITKVIGTSFALIVGFTILIDLYQGVNPSGDLDP